MYAMATRSRKEGATGGVINRKAIKSNQLARDCSSKLYADNCNRKILCFDMNEKLMSIRSESCTLLSRMEIVFEDIDSFHVGSHVE